MGWLEEVQKRASEEIVEIIGEYVSLQRAGSSYRALCPFHSEKTPSFFVSPSRGIFKCFGCGKGGDAIKFVADYENVSYVEAAKKLAKRFGIDVPEERQNKQLSPKYEALAFAASHYAESLRRHKEALDYLTKERKVSPDVIREEKIGFAPFSQAEDSLISVLKKDEQKGQRFLKELKELKHVKSAAGGLKDAFEGRVVMPVCDKGGRVIGFTGRVVPSLWPEELLKRAPKYLNSATSDVFDKSKALLGLNPAAIEYARRGGQVIIVEGLFDVLRLKSLGKLSTFAPMGTGLTKEHVSLILSLARDVDVVLIFDGDEAGRRAAEKAVFLFARAGVLARVVFLPPGEDPDTYYLKAGYRGLLNDLKNAKVYFEHLLLQIKETEDPEQREKLVETYFALLKALPSGEKKQAWAYEYRRRVGLKAPGAAKGPWPPPEVRKKENVDAAEADFLLGLLHGEEEEPGALLKRLPELFLSKRTYELAKKLLLGEIEDAPDWLIKAPLYALSERYRNAKNVLEDRYLNVLAALDVELLERELRKENVKDKEAKLKRLRAVASGGRGYLYKALVKAVLSNPAAWHLPEDVKAYVQKLQKEQNEQSPSKAKEASNELKNEHHQHKR